MKALSSDRRLAVLGGAPAFLEPLHVGRPNIGSRASFSARLDAVLDSRWLTNNGPMVRAFEAAICDHLSVRHCICTCNATVALEIGARVLGLQGEVICPSFTFVATAHALAWQGIDPVFCDVELETHCIDPDAIEALVTPRTTGVVGVHLWGRSCDVERIENVCRRHGLRLMLDAAHAFSCERAGRRIGNFGDLEILSFHATKFLNSFEGGAIVTNDEAIAERARRVRDFGFAGLDQVVCLGINGKMTESCAAMGLTNLESIEEFVSINRRNYRTYSDELAGLSGVRLEEYEAETRSNFQYVVARVDESEAGLTRDELVALLRAENVLARRYFHPGCHRMEPYRSRDPLAGQRLGRTEILADSVLCLPTGTAVGQAEIATIVELLGTALRSSAAVREALRARREGVLDLDARTGSDGHGP